MQAHLGSPPERCPDGAHAITLPLTVTTPDGATHPARLGLTQVQAEHLAARIQYLLPEH